MTDDKHNLIGRLNAVKKALVARRPNHETRGGGRHENKDQRAVISTRRDSKGQQLHPLPLSLRLAAGLLVVLVFACADTFSARAVEPSPTIRVHVSNYAEATPTTVSKAEHEASPSSAV